MGAILTGLMMKNIWKKDPLLLLELGIIKVIINRKEFFIGFEALYDYGFTNTYGKQERDGKSIDVGHLVDYENVPLKGKRSFTGVEMQVTFGMPFDFNFHRREKPQTTRSVRNL